MRVKDFLEGGRIFIFIASSCSSYSLRIDPAEADKLLKIQRDLDETKIILVSMLSL